MHYRRADAAGGVMMSAARLCHFACEGMAEELLTKNTGHMFYSLQSLVDTERKYCVSILYQKVTIGTHKDKLAI